MTAYTTSAAIAAYLGVTFTPEQDTAATQVADAVTTFIDRYTGRSWQGTSPVAGEQRRLVPPVPGGAYPSAVAFLAHTPTLAVAAVSLRSASTNASETALDAGEYELFDPEHGVLAIADSSWWWCGDMLAVVDYTYADALPADIALAATMIAAGEMSRQLALAGSSSFAAAHPELDGLKRVSVGQNDVTIDIADAASATGASAGASLAPAGSTARTILDGYRRVVIA